MKNKKLHITIGGTTGTGKSSVLYLLDKFLSEQGFTVDSVLADDVSNLFIENIEDILESVKSNTLIILNEVQMNREL